MAAVVLARLGAHVTAFDLSGGYLREARARAAANDVALDLIAADGARLPFADGTFDGVWGNAILHHLDIVRAGREIRRILRPGGVAVFCEPWGGNPLLEWARRHLAYPGKERTPDERPLQASQVEQLRQVFPDLEMEGFQLLSMVRRIWRLRPLLAVLERFDEVLLRRLPILQRWCRYVVLTLRRPSVSG
jgi:SAM-dependent methyltransferase